MSPARGAVAAGLLLAATLSVNAGGAAMFDRDDFAQLRFLEGRWQGQAPDGGAFYEQYDFPGEDTLRSQRFADQGFAAATDGSTVTLREGVVEARWGEFAWRASELAVGRACFEPVNAPGGFCWHRVDEDTLHVVQRWTDAQGQAQEAVLPLRRIAAR
jgi:hypothetical protein